MVVPATLMTSQDISLHFYFFIMLTVSPWTSQPPSVARVSFYGQVSVGQLCKYFCSEPCCPGEAAPIPSILAHRTSVSVCLPSLAAPIFPLTPEGCGALAQLGGKGALSFTISPFIPHLSGREARMCSGAGTCLQIIIVCKRHRATRTCPKWSPR